MWQAGNATCSGKPGASKKTRAPLQQQWLTAPACRQSQAPHLNSLLLHSRFCVGHTRGMRICPPISMSASTTKLHRAAGQGPRWIGCGKAGGLCSTGHPVDGPGMNGCAADCLAVCLQSWACSKIVWKNLRLPVLAAAALVHAPDLQSFDRPCRSGAPPTCVSPGPRRLDRASRPAPTCLLMAARATDTCQAWVGATTCLFW